MFRPRWPPTGRSIKVVRKGTGPGARLVPPGSPTTPNVVPADQAPKTWEEAIEPKWTDAITVKLSTSGLQHVSWFELRGLYGPDYWKKFGELKPKGFDSYVQQFDRLV